MDRCALCPGLNNCLPPDGPEDADLLFIGEAPGKNEDKRGRVFIGKTGEEVDRGYLPLAGLRRDRVLFTNAIACLPTSAGGKLDPNSRRDQALLASCASARLHPLLESRPWRAVVPMGSFACRAVIPDVDLELCHGRPVDTDWGVPSFPMYHPALGIHEPKKMLYLRTDWGRLRKWLEGRLLLPVDEYPTPDYREVTSEEEIEEIDPCLPLACDTESKKGGAPFCLTYSHRPGFGRLIQADQVHLLAAFQQKIDSGHAPVLFHNWLYDWGVTTEMGLRLPIKRIRDTMALVYHLGNLPQGLKALALRELGMQMQDFDDLVLPYSTELVLDYYRQAQLVTWPKPEADLVIEGGKWKVYKPQSLNTKLKRFFTDYSKNEEKDVFKMWTANWVEQQAMMEEQLGPWPGPCITHVPFEKTLYYACRDADALIRLWPIIRRMSKQVRRYSQELWREKAA